MQEKDLDSIVHGSDEAICSMCSRKLKTKIKPPRTKPECFRKY